MVKREQSQRNLLRIFAQPCSGKLHRIEGKIWKCLMLTTIWRYKIHSEPISAHNVTKQDIMIVWYCVIISPPKAWVSIACLDRYSLMLVLQLQDNLTLGQQDVQGDAQVDIRVNFQGKCGYVDDICHYQFLPLSQLQEVVFHIVIYVWWVMS